MECFVPPRETETLAAAAFKVRLRTIKAQYCRVILGFAFSIPRISVLPGGARVPAYELLRRSFVACSGSNLVDSMGFYFRAKVVKGAGHLLLTNASWGCLIAMVKSPSEGQDRRKETDHAQYLFKNSLIVSASRVH